MFWPATSTAGELDLAALASVHVTSEQSLFPIDHVFETVRGPGSSCWISEDAGEQLVTVEFDRPQDVRGVSIESEDHGKTRTQTVELSISSDGGEIYRELPRREFKFSPYGTTFERESWDVSVDAATHLRVRIMPDRAGGEGRASLTSIVVR